jgi:hypothetical protein
VSHYDRVQDLVAIIMETVSSETRIDPQYLGVEIESVLMRGVLESYKRGREDAKLDLLISLRTRIPPTAYQHLLEETEGGSTKPPPGRNTKRPARGVFHKDPLPRQRVPTPVPRKIRDPRKEEDG